MSFLRKELNQEEFIYVSGILHLSSFMFVSIELYTFLEVYMLAKFIICVERTLA